MPKDSSDENSVLRERPVESGREGVSTVEVKGGEAGAVEFRSSELRETFPGFTFFQEVPTSLGFHAGCSHGKFGC